MKLIEAFSCLARFHQPFFTTNDAATLWQLTPAHASKLLSRLHEQKLLLNLGRAKWALTGIDPLAAVEFLTAPEPAYLSLQTALYHHGMVSQIPAVIYAISTSRTRRHETELGTYSIHHVEPKFFYGFTTVGKHNIKIATPEKALLDIFYLSPARSGLFRKLPEIELPRSFNFTVAKKLIQKIPSSQRRHMLESKLLSLKNQRHDDFI